MYIVWPCKNSFVQYMYLVSLRRLPSTIQYPRYHASAGSIKQYHFCIDFLSYTKNCTNTVPCLYQLRCIRYWYLAMGTMFKIVAFSFVWIRTMYWDYVKWDGTSFYRAMTLEQWRPVLECLREQVMACCLTAPSWKDYQITHTNIWLTHKLETHGCKLSIVGLLSNALALKHQAISTNKATVLTK